MTQPPEQPLHDEPSADPAAAPRLFSSAERGWSITLVLAYVAWRLGAFAFRVARPGPHDIVGEGMMLGFVVFVGGIAFFVIRRSRQQELERQRQLDAWRHAGDRLAK